MEGRGRAHRGCRPHVHSALPQLLPERRHAPPHRLRREFVLESGPTQSVVSRDTGFQARGYLAHNRLEYRVGAFQGARETTSRNSFRSAGHLQYAFLDPESGFFTTGTYLGKKKVLTIGGGYDVQSDYKAFAADAFFDRPIGAAGAVTLQADLIHYDGGETFNLPKQNDLLVEGGYLFTRARVMPWVKPRRSA